jgi:hypothetical protein
MALSNAQVALLAAGGVLHAPTVIGMANSTPADDWVLRRAAAYKAWLDEQDQERTISDQTYTGGAS